MTRRMERPTDMWRAETKSQTESSSTRSPSLTCLNSKMKKTTNQKREQIGANGGVRTKMKCSNVLFARHLLQYPKRSPGESNIIEPTRPSLRVCTLCVSLDTSISFPVCFLDRVCVSRLSFTSVRHFFFSGSRSVRRRPESISIAPNGEKALHCTAEQLNVIHWDIRST